MQPNKTVCQRFRPAPARNEFNYRFCAARLNAAKGGFLHDALTCVLGMCVLFSAYFAVSLAIWAVEKFIN